MEVLLPQHLPFLVQQLHQQHTRVGKQQLHAVHRQDDIAILFHLGELGAESEGVVVLGTIYIFKTHGGHLKLIFTTCLTLEVNHGAVVAVGHAGVRPTNPAMGGDAVHQVEHLHQRVGFAVDYVPHRPLKGNPEGIVVRVFLRHFVAQKSSRFGRAFGSRLSGGGCLFGSAVNQSQRVVYVLVVQQQGDGVAVLVLCPNVQRVAPCIGLDKKGFAFGSA